MERVSGHDYYFCEHMHILKLLYTQFLLCIPSCRDYLEISRDEQALGPIEFCEEEYQKLRFVAVGGFKATFRTNHHQEYVNGMWKEKKWVTRAPNDYYEGFQTYCMCFNDECK